MAKAILFDATKCVGCRLCEVACAERNHLPYDETIATEEQLSAYKVTAVQTCGAHFVRRLCMHCLEPTCASVCPVGALYKSELGPVVYAPERCIGCRYCMLACPFQVPAYEWNSRLPRVKKCDMCVDRLQQGELTACAQACPTEATTCGDRDALIAEARRRVTESPDQYYQHIYGLEQVGGTSVLFLSPVPFEQLGMRAHLPQQALPILTWRALAHIPDIVLVGSVLLGGVWWITHRRDEVAAAERALKEKEKKQ